MNKTLNKVMFRGKIDSEPRFSAWDIHQKKFSDGLDVRDDGLHFYANFYLSIYPEERYKSIDKPKLYRASAARIYCESRGSVARRLVTHDVVKGDDVIVFGQFHVATVQKPQKNRMSKRTTMRPQVEVSDFVMVKEARRKATGRGVWVDAEEYDRLQYAAKVIDEQMVIPPEAMELLAKPLDLGHGDPGESGS